MRGSNYIESYFWFDNSSHVLGHYFGAETGYLTLCFTKHSLFSNLVSSSDNSSDAVLFSWGEATIFASYVG